MKTILSKLFAGGVICFATVSIAGCGGGQAQTQDKSFFTSGNREADQRADQTHGPGAGDQSRWQ